MQLATSPTSNLEAPRLSLQTAEVVSTRLTSRFDLTARLGADHGGWQTVQISLNHNPRSFFRNTVTQVWDSTAVLANELPVSRDHLGYLLAALKQTIGRTVHEEYLQKETGKPLAPDAWISHLLETGLRDTVTMAHHSLDGWREVERWLRENPKHPLLYGHKFQLVPSAAISFDEEVRGEVSGKTITMTANPFKVRHCTLINHIRYELKQLGFGSPRGVEFSEDPLYKILATTMRDLHFHASLKSPLDRINHFGFLMGTSSHDPLFYDSAVQNTVAVSRLSETLARIETYGLDADSTRVHFHVATEGQAAAGVLGEYLRFIELGLHRINAAEQEPNNKLFRQFAAFFGLNAGGQRSHELDLIYGSTLPPLISDNPLKLS